MEVNKFNFILPKQSELNLYFFKDVDEQSVLDFYKDYHKLLTDYKDLIKENRKFYNNIEYFEYKYLPINIHLNTYGGSCYDGLSMYSKIKNESMNSDFDTNIIASGLIASMGIILLCSVPYKNRKAYKDTMFMIHQLSAITWGEMKSIEDKTEELKRLNKQLFDIIKERTNITEEELNKVYTEKKDWFITADEAKRLGLISEIID